eukprot:scaffold6717_cov160-Amphora_coffeaeformis.AAC.5
MNRQSTRYKRRIDRDVSFLRSILAWSCLLLVTTTTTVHSHTAFGRRRAGVVAAGIFGIGGNNKAEEKATQRPPMLPPPPPYNPQSRNPLQPPPPPRGNDNHGSTLSDAATSLGNQTQKGRLPPPPPLPNQQSQNTQKHQQLPPPPPSGWDQQQQQQQQQQPPPQYWEFAPQAPFPPPEAVFHDLDQALQREAGLVQQVQNLSATVGMLEQREDLHVRQMDVLTERIMQVESAAASKETKLIEMQTNCTALHKEVARLKGELKEYEARCSEFVEVKEKLETETVDLGKQLKAARRQAENLATLIERHRLEEEKEKKVVKKRKSRGFFAWLFGIRSDEDEDEEEWEELKDTARSTLLQALQNERNNVEELESVVSVLQSNNSAISDQVESRDAIIDELNNRIAVFEEDKVVLKAALRQLQKEIKEEAPKTARLLSDLKAAQNQIAQLEAKMETARQAHANEMAKLDRVISQKNQLLNQSQANLTMIGTYVDKLEERLADFAVARRDINVRSEKLDGLQGEIQALNEDKRKLKEQIASYEQEHAELKKLMEDMAKERSKLLKQNNALASDRDVTQAELQRLYKSLETAEYELKGERNVTDYWERATRDLESEMKKQADEYKRLLQQQRSEDAVSPEIRQRLEQLEQQQNEWQSRLSQAESVRDDLIQKLQAATRSQITAEEQVDALQRNLTAIEEQRQKDASLLAEALEARQKMEELLGESQEIEKLLREEARAKMEAMQQEARQREGVLQRKVVEQEDELQRTRKLQMDLKKQNTGRVGETKVEENSATMESDEEIETGEEYNDDSDDEEESQKETNEGRSLDKNRGKRSGTTSNKTSPELSQRNDAAQNQTASDVSAGLNVNATSLKNRKDLSANAKQGSPSHRNQTQRHPLSRRPPPPTQSSLRNIRKFFAKSTGLHGFFSGKKIGQKHKMQPRPRDSTNATLPSNVTACNTTRVQQRDPPGNIPQHGRQRQAGSPPEKPLQRQFGGVPLNQQQRGQGNSPHHLQSQGRSAPPSQQRRPGTLPQDAQKPLSRQPGRVPPQQQQSQGSRIPPHQQQRQRSSYPPQRPGIPPQTFLKRQSQQGGRDPSGIPPPEQQPPNRQQNQAHPSRGGNSK